MNFSLLLHGSMNQTVTFILYTLDSFALS